MKTIQKLNSQLVIFFSCDMQSLFNNPKLIYGIEGVIEATKFMTELAGIMKIPVIISEHNPKVFGETIPEIKQLIPQNHYIYIKQNFSMINEECLKFLESMKQRKVIVLYGIETHICISATCIDLINKGYEVHLVTDGSSSSKQIFRSTAFQKLQQQGVILNTTQGVMFELLGDYTVPEFKDCIKLVKKYPNDQIMTHL